MAPGKNKNAKNEDGPDQAILKLGTLASKFEISSVKAMLADYPEIASQWHPTLNVGLDVAVITAKSHKKVWWKFTAVSDHEWSAAVSNRTSGRGCPFCSGKAVSRSNSLAALTPKSRVSGIRRKINN
jgi:hypothetical protein